MNRARRIRVFGTVALLAWVAATPAFAQFSGYYRVMARHSGKAVTVQSASTSNGANVFQWTYGGSATNDEWELRDIGSGYYRVINRNSGKDMVVQSASTSNGANVFQYTYGGSNTNDEWAIVSLGNGYHRFTNRNSGKALDVVGAGTADGTNIDQWTYSGATNQQFQIASVGTCSMIGPGSNSSKTITCNGLSLVFTDKGGGVSQDTRNKIVETFFSGYLRERSRFNTSAPTTVHMTIDPAYSGVAATSGSSVTCGASWLASHPLDVDGCGTHEFMHVAQAYTSGSNPGWAVEGLADYARYRYGLYNSQAGWSLGNYSSGQSYTNGYRVTARFFVWLETHIRSTILDELDDSMKSGTYSSSFWTAKTGKTVDQLWSQYTANPAL